ncbi:MAG: RdgB/HAM1 family non-canonical purine NTP pyrophosphatase [Oscillospiraceae bacterium]
MTREIIVATGNPNKLKEFERILAPLGFKVLMADKKITDKIEETGSTFTENSLIKARTVFLETGLPTIADDSGICIDFLDGAPGVYSARYLGEETPYSVKNAKILEVMKDIPPEKRCAHYECVISLITPKGEYIFEGRCDGAIGTAPRGENGFGYDPIFYTNGKSYAELSDKEKDAISHRGIALKNFSENFDSIEF